MLVIITEMSILTSLDLPSPHVKFTSYLGSLGIRIQRPLLLKFISFWFEDLNGEQRVKKE